MFLIARITIFLIIILGIIGLMTGDITSNYSCLAQFWNRYAAFGFGAGLTSCLFILSLYKQRNLFQNIAFITLIVGSATLSIGFVFLEKTQDSENRFNDDPLLNRWTCEHTRLIAEQKADMQRYERLYKEGAKNGAIECREKADGLQPRIDDIQQKISNRESQLQKSGSQFNESLYRTGIPYFAFLTHILIGIACPLAISVLGGTLQQITTGWILSKNEFDIADFWNNPSKCFPGNTQETPRKHPGNTQETPTVSWETLTSTPKASFFMNIVLLKFVGETSQETLNEIGETVRKLLNRDKKFSKGYISKALRGQYDKKLLEDPRLLKEVTSHAKAIYKKHQAQS